MTVLTNPNKMITFDQGCLLLRVPISNSLLQIYLKEVQKHTCQSEVMPMIE
jgi:hypothetical protein